jgi:pimeloyl-ACP methyl ester carboxylesterase
MDKLVGSGESNPYQLAESIWTESNQNIVDFFKTISSDRHYQICYEDLVTQPDKITQELCQFLGIDFDASLLNPYQGNRMTDGVYDKSLSVGDPNFRKRQQIDAKLANNWQEIKLPYLLLENTRQLALSFDYELPQEQQLPSPSMEEQFINVRGLNLCLCTWGTQQGSPILLLHGILEQGAAWNQVAIRLAEKGYRAIAPDLRGHGKSDHISPGSSYNLLDFLGDIDVIAAQLNNQTVTLVGHSLGSVIAAMFASIRPQKVKELILVETVLPTEVKEEETVEQLATHLDYLISPPEHPVFPDLATAAKRLQLATPSLSETLAMQLAKRITETCTGGIRWKWDSKLRTRAGIEFNGINKSRYLNLLQRIPVPITLIYGDRSDFNRPEDLLEQQKALQNAKRIVISGGHNLHLETPVELAKIIDLSINKSIFQK